MKWLRAEGGGRRAREEALVGVGVRALAGAIMLSVLTISAVGQDSETPAPAAEPAAGAPDPGEVELASEQDALSLRYARFEQTLLQMSEYLRKTDPEQANLIVRAIGRSKDDRIAQQMEQIIELMESEQLGDAVERQEQVLASLRALLQLLQSEDRKSEIEREKERLNAILKNVGRLLGREKDIRAVTERGGDLERAVDKQEGISGDAGRLMDSIDQQDAERNRPPEGEGEPKPGQEIKPDEESDPNQPESEPQEPEVPSETPRGSKGEPKPSESQSKGQPSDPKESESQGGEPKPSESEQGKPSPSGESQPSEQGQSGEPQEGEQQPQQGPQQQQKEKQQKKTPGREEIEKARDAMDKAIEELKKKSREDASEQQNEAIEQLMQAKEKLEEMLRQLREEEQELLLASLEARLQQMLAMQVQVYDGTTTVAKTPKEERNDRHDARCRELAQQEDAVATEAAKALTLLKEEGSSVAFPESIGQLRQDMLTVARRLERTEADEFTLGVERDIIESLEEMIAALQKELEKIKKDKQQGGPQQQGGQPGNEALVDNLAELKMLRSLQMRINRRTRQVGGMITGEQATDGELRAELQQLSARQSRIQEATYDLARGKNK